MSDIVIGFSKPSKFTIHGWIIEKIDGAPFDHAYIRVVLDGLDRCIVFQSIAVGVQIVSENQFKSLSTPVEEYSLPVTDDQFKAVMQFCIDNSGKSYGLLNVIGLGLSKLLQKLGIKKKNPIDEQGKDFCSQVIALCLDTVDPSQFNIDPDNTSPMDLRNLIQQINLTRIL